MRCLVVADLHYSLPQFDWLLAAAPQFDVVIFAGDALDIGSFVDFRAQILVVKKYLSLLSGMTWVHFCSGNHDLDERSAEGEKMRAGSARSANSASPATVMNSPSATCTPRCVRGGTGRGEEPPRSPASRRGSRTGATLDPAHHAPRANSPTSWGGKRSSAMSNRRIGSCSSSRRRRSGPTSSSPLYSRRLVVRPAGTTGVFNRGPGACRR